MLVGIPTVFLGPVHGNVSMLKQRRVVVAIAWIHAGTDTCCDEALGSGNLEWHLHRSDHPSRHQINVSLTLNLGEQHDELVAAESCHTITLTYALLQPTAGLGQQFVPGIVTKRIIDHLEVIQINEKHPENTAMPFGGNNRLVNAIKQQRSIGQAGQCIMAGLPADRIQQAQRFRDIVKD